MGATSSRVNPGSSSDAVAKAYAKLALAENERKQTEHYAIKALHERDAAYEELVSMCVGGLCKAATPCCSPQLLRHAGFRAHAPYDT